MPPPITITINDQEKPLTLDLNTADLFFEQTGKNIIAGDWWPLTPKEFKLLLVCAIREPGISIDNIGSMIPMNQIAKILVKITDALGAGGDKETPDPS